MATNTSVGGVHPAEIRFAELVCNRFGHQRVRFTNSGTEANLMAITLSRIVTGRATIMVMHGGYHGGVFYYSHGNAPWNAPFHHRRPVQRPRGVRAVDRRVRRRSRRGHRRADARFGMRARRARFLSGLANATQRAGAVFITDEVMTSRHGPRGLADLLGAFGPTSPPSASTSPAASRSAPSPDSAELLDHFDATKPDSIPHAGTFNNNIATMSAGCVVLGEIFTSDTAISLTARGEELRARIDDVLHQHKLPLNITGFGSMNAVSRIRAPTAKRRDLLDRDPVLQEALFLSLLQRGVYTAPRGSLNLGLAITEMGRRPLPRRARRIAGRARGRGVEADRSVDGLRRSPVARIV